MSSLNKTLQPPPPLKKHKKVYTDDKTRPAILEEKSIDL